MLAETVRDVIRTDISDAKYQPGQKLNEVHVAAAYDVSRNTLREAFAMLAAERLVERVPNRGVYIATPDIGYVTDLYRARAIIEPAGALWGNHLNATGLVETTNDALEAADRGDMIAIARCNQHFHRQLVAGCGSASLDAEMSNLLARMRLTFLKVLPLHPDLHLDYVEKNSHVAQLLADGQRHQAANQLHWVLHDIGEKIIEILKHA